jgi:hypothetical protein
MKALLFSGGEIHLKAKVFDNYICKHLRIYRNFSGSDKFTNWIASPSLENAYFDS